MLAFVYNYNDHNCTGPARSKLNAQWSVLSTSHRQVSSALGSNWWTMSDMIPLAQYE